VITKASLRPASIGALAILVIVASLAVAPQCVAAAIPNPSELWHTPEDRAAGAGAGLFEFPEGVVADPTTGNIYVLDRNAARVSKFTAFGVFLKAWGWGVATGAAELQTCGPQATPPTSTCLKGLKGSGAGQFDTSFFGMGGIAVGADGSVWVADMSNHRLQKFGPEGKFLLMIGGGVNKGPVHPGDICTAINTAEGDTCGVGVAGGANGQFETQEFGTYIAVAPSGSIFVGDKGRIQVFEPDGSFKSSITLQGALAGKTVGSVTIDVAGNIWVMSPGDHGRIHKLNSSGADLIPAVEVEGGNDPLATDAEGNLYAATTSDRIRKEEVGGVLKEIPDGKITEVIEFASDGTPVIPQGSGFAKSLQPNGEPEGVHVPVGLAANVVTGDARSDVYLAALNETKSFVTAYGPAPTLWPPPLAAPEIVSQYALTIESNAAVLGANINPKFWDDTSYYLEYGTGKCSDGACTNLVPAPPGQQLGAGVTGVPVAANGIPLPNLQPNTTYHYRFLAQSTGSGNQPVRGVGGKVGVDGTEAAFTTPPIPPVPPADTCPNREFRSDAAAALSNCRAYEMVSPIDKNGTDIITLANLNGNLNKVDQSSTSGDKLTFTTSQGFGDPAGVPYVSQYLSSRGPSGWGTHDLTPPQGTSSEEIGNRLDLEFRAFTPDLCSGVLVNTTSLTLAPGAAPGFFNLYRRENCGTEGFEALSTLPPPPGADVFSFKPEPQGTSKDGRCTVYLYRLATRPLYQSCNGELQLVSRLPNGEPSGVSATAGSLNDEAIGVRTGNILRAMSADGSRIYWTASESPKQLYLRINADQDQSAISAGACTEPTKACTIKVPTKGKASHFWAGSADGSKAIFTLEEGGAVELDEFNLSGKKTSAIATEVLGVIGASADASRTYFVSRKVLSAGANAAGEEPTAGAPNLYFYDSALTGPARYKFIGALSSNDARREPGFTLSPVAAEPYKHTSRVTPDGAHMAFMSTAQLTGFDNTDAVSGEADAEIFTYDATANAGAGALSCVSCNPTGQRPTGRALTLEEVSSGTWGAALLAPFQTELFGSRSISDDGKRIFFDSYDRLTGADTNGKADVYEWEAAGSDQSPGACTPQSPSFSPPNGGCLSLISTGKSESDSEFLDASPDGRDVFFTTDQSLVPQDPDLIDIYDARAGGGFPSPPAQPAPCEGEACQAQQPPPAQPNAATSNPGPGNPKFKLKCPKGAHRVKSHGKERCVKNKAHKKGHKKAKSGKKKAHKSGGARR
jgi:hypothetical protein